MFRGLLLGLILSLSITQVEAQPPVISFSAWQAVKYFPVNQQATALTVFYCESTWNNQAKGTYGESGIPQIHPIHFTKYGVTSETLESPVLAGLTAYQIWLESGWKAWACYG